MKPVSFVFSLMTSLTLLVPQQSQAQGAPTAQIQKPKEVLTTVKPQLANNFNPPVAVQVDKAKLSVDATKAISVVAKWSANNKQLWLIVYRETNESYIFSSYNGVVSVFSTNPEKGGEYSIPYKTLFTINPVLLSMYARKQDSTGAYKFPGGYYENYVTPLMKIYPNGKLVPGQDNTLPWAIHTPPYNVKGQPSTDLTRAGNSCLRVNFGFAKYMQDFAVSETQKTSGIKIYLRRWDNSLL
jgi:hypothetical protein